VVTGLDCVPDSVQTPPSTVHVPQAPYSVGKHIAPSVARLQARDSGVTEDRQTPIVQVHAVVSRVSIAI
jgi:hypothetical protein